MSLSFRRRFSTISTLAIAVVIGTFCVAGPANADSGPISGTQADWNVVYWNTARTDTQVKNVVSFYFTDNAGGINLAVAIRPGIPSSSGTYARATGPSGHTTTLIHDSDGVPYVPRGTFYLSTSPQTSVGNNPVTWTGTLYWNRPYAS